MIKALLKTTPLLLCAAALAVTAQAQAQAARTESNTAKVIPGQMVVDESTAVVRRMKQDAHVAGLIDHAKAVYIVPRYGASPSRLIARSERHSPGGDSTPAAKAMLRHGSPGVFLVHTVNWSAPAFFSMSAVDSHTNAANHTEPARGMPLVMIFMTARAAHQMQLGNNVELSGLNVMRYADHPSASMADADVVLWTPQRMTHRSDLAKAEIHFDSNASNAYYMNQATLPEILSSNVSTPRAANLQGALSMRLASAK